MASHTDIWPSSPITVSPRVKHLITRFFDIADSTDPKSGKLLAELFTKDGVFKTHETCVFKGRDEIAASRENNPQVVVSRSHELVRVWAADSPATDLAVLGKFGLALKDGSSVTIDFNARFVVVGEEEEERLELMRVWTDPTAMLDAIKKANENLGTQD